MECRDDASSADTVVAMLCGSAQAPGRRVNTRVHAHTHTRTHARLPIARSLHPVAQLIEALQWREELRIEKDDVMTRYIATRSPNGSPERRR